MELGTPLTDFSGQYGRGMVGLNPPTVEILKRHRPRRVWVSESVFPIDFLHKNNGEITRIENASLSALMVT